MDKAERGAYHRTYKSPRRKIAPGAGALADRRTRDRYETYLLAENVTDERRFSTPEAPITAAEIYESRAFDRIIDRTITNYLTEPPAGRKIVVYTPTEAYYSLEDLQSGSEEEILAVLRSFDAAAILR